jgi:serine beta-lactamase-like protein LACTB, mitochondrial
MTAADAVGSVDRHPAGRRQVLRLGLVVPLAALLAAVFAPAAATAVAGCARRDIERQWAPAVDAVAADPLVGGVSVAMGSRDGYRWSYAKGFANIELKAPMTSATKSRIGSVSKVVVASALMHLVQGGALDLDTPIQAYVPGFRRHDRPITLRLLAGHLAGIRHYEPGDQRFGPGGDWHSSHLREYKSVAEAIEIFSNDPLVHQPGEQFAYSSYAWTLISAAIEYAVKKPFLQWLQDDWLPRLAMTETVPDELYRIVPNRAAFYEPDGSVLKIAPLADRSFVWAGGGLLSTPRDLISFALQTTGPGVLDRESLRIMLSPQHTMAGQAIDYGIGWQVGYSRHADELLDGSGIAPLLANRLRRAVAGLPRTVGHDGSAPGAVAQLLVAPDQGVAVAYVVNANTETDPWFYRLQVAQLEAFAQLARRAKTCDRTPGPSGRAP